MTKTIFITGTDTDAGKSYATGYLGKLLREQGLKVKTMKFIQTGNVGRSEDIELHRKIMGDSIENEDYRLSAPIIRSYPCSPDLAARLDNNPIDLTPAIEAIAENEKYFDVVLLEGAGGLMVPINDEMVTADFITDQRLDVALVTNGKLGSINHTLLALEAIERRGLNLRYLLYNAHFDYDATIAEDTRRYLRNVLSRRFLNTEWVEIPSL